VGTETSREQRDWIANETILSGDLKGDDVGFTNNGENSYHVVIGDETNSTAVLDGFIITGGNANADIWPNDGGGGMSNYQGSPTIANCTFRGNSAYADGGGMRNWGNSNPTVTNCTLSENSSSQEGGGMMNGEVSSPMVTNCTFSGNSAGEDGGGMYNNQTSNPMVTNCTFSGNSADLTGGGMYNVNSSSPVVTNCTFSGNSAGEDGGGMCNIESNPTLTNCILWDDSAPTDPEIHNSGSTPIVSYSDIAGGYPGIGNIDEDPLFADPDLRLSAGSQCIDVGKNTAVPDGVTTDLDANPRIIHGNVDMGAHEFALRNE
jgi:parallel beta-helix repeat protein